MKISEYAVKNYQFTLVIFLMVIALGVSTLLHMPRAEDPEMEIPFFPVVVIYPGASPEDLEELVVDPIERAFSELDDVDVIKSFILDGLVIIRIDFDFGVDVEDKYQALIREIGTLRDKLPQDIHSIEVKKVSPSDVSIMQIALVSENASRETMKQQAEELQDLLETIPELKLVEIHGLPQPTVRVELQMEKIAKLRLPTNLILGSIQSEIVNIPGGSLDAGDKVFNIKTDGSYQSIEDIENTLISGINGNTLRLKDVANVSFDFSEDKHITRLNSHRCILVTAAQKDGNNISETKLKYEPILKEFQENLPQNIAMVKHFDQADNVNRRLNKLGTEFLIAIFLVSITLLPLGFRAAFIVMVSIPLSLAIGLILLNLLGYQLNQLSIVGLVVALGLLVDDSIVVVENIERWLRDGYSKLDAAIKATKQIGLAVIGCTATLIIAFLPLVFLPDASGDFIRSLPMAVILCVLASMVVSLTIIPFLSSVILKQHHGNEEGNIFLQALQKIIHKSYAPFLDAALKHPLITLVVALVIFIGSLQLIPVIGFSLFPPSEKAQFMINITSPIQTNLNKTDEITQEVEKLLEEYSEIEYYTSNVGMGNPQVYYNEIQENERNDFAQIFIQLQENTPIKTKAEVISRMRRQFKSFPDATIEVKDFEQGPPVLAPIEVRLFGKNLDTLRSLANQVQKMLNNTEGAIYVNNPLSHMKSSIKVKVNKEKASALAVSGIDIDRTVRLAAAGFSMGKFNDANNNEYDIMVTTPKESRATLDIFNNLYVNNRAGTPIPILQIADLELESSPVTIRHHNKKRMTAVMASVDNGYLNDDVINATIQQMEQMKLPKGYSYSMGGEVETREKSFGGFGSVIIVTVFLFIAVLILEFGTFKSTLIVLSVIPLGIVGSVIALLITGNSLSFVAIVGLIALAGIEVKNSILLVDFTNQLREQGKTLDEAIREAGEVRFLPIILTSMTAIGGLIPIALSSNPLISPLAIVLIGGLISSTLLSRVVTPVVYKLIPPKITSKADKL